MKVRSVRLLKVSKLRPPAKEQWLVHDVNDMMWAFAYV